MSLNAQGYFNALRCYLNAEYEVTDTDAGRIVLKEKVFVGGSPKPVVYKVRLGVTGEALVINLDRKNRNGNSDPLFHFLDDNAKPWSKRCDFVVFNLREGADQRPLFRVQVGYAARFARRSVGRQ